MALTICSSCGEIAEMERLIGELVRRAVKSLAPSDSESEIDRRTFTDLEDIRLSKQGDSEAYRRLIERYQEHVAAILWRFSRDRQVHEELVQDAFVEAYLSLGGYSARAPFGHWLARIATRVGYHYWKQRARRRQLESLSLQEWDQVVDEGVERMDPEQAATLVHDLMSQLPPRDRLVLTLRYLEGCDVAETARRTGWTKAMVKVQTMRARRKLEKLFRASGKELE